jgi:hypothetical protein
VQLRRIEPDRDLLYVRTEPVQIVKLVALAERGARRSARTRSRGEGIQRGLPRWRRRRGVSDSARCRNRVAHDQFVREVAAAKQAYGDAAMQTFSIDQISGGLARVTYTYDKAAINQASEPWVFEDGAWDKDDC